LNRNVIFILCVVGGITALLLVGKRATRPSGPVGTAIGAQAPDFTLKSVPDGKMVQLSGLKGKAVLVNFWATWCEPCKVEIPWLVDLQKKYGPQGLQIVGITKEDGDEKTITDFTKKMGVNYTILVGTSNVMDQYGGIDGLPTSFFLDRSGKVVRQVVGLDSESVLEDAIKKSLAQ
jgi:thiol-disulfide isomerase/thioredoxin